MIWRLSRKYWRNNWINITALHCTLIHGTSQDGPRNPGILSIPGSTGTPGMGHPGIPSIPGSMGPPGMGHPGILQAWYMSWVCGSCKPLLLWCAYIPFQASENRWACSNVWPCEVLHRISMIEVDGSIFIPCECIWTAFELLRWAVGMDASWKQTMAHLMCWFESTISSPWDTGIFRILATLY